MSNVPQAVGELLEFGAVTRDVEVALNDAAKLSFKKDDPLELVVTK
jgi:hypothetical protein